ncbi:hypothetical protein CCGE531_32695 (plasmid) [Rhizobium sp. CCGE531]|nr:hypothetical protein CCGE531_32695 [Rhizobium sp. CCGE531]AYG77092.1 hypothetical protein CCGE532_31850 [Rhizobium sp. CCGE532]
MKDKEIVLRGKTWLFTGRLSKVWRKFRDFARAEGLPMSFKQLRFFWRPPKRHFPAAAAVASQSSGHRSRRSAKGASS